MWFWFIFQKDFCKKRIVACQYCNLELKADDIDEHEDYCGSRTECCHECGRHIMLKFQHLHLDSNHKFIKLNDSKHRLLFINIIPSISVIWNLFSFFW